MTDLKKLAEERGEYLFEPSRYKTAASIASAEQAKAAYIAAYLAGARAGIEAAARLAYHGVETSAGHSHSSRTIASAIRSLLPEVSP